jgi:tRNA (guanine-N1)-methyltransferase
VVLLSPQGQTLTQSLAAEFADGNQLVLICGRYEGVDERVADALVTDEVSIGDYVLSGGEPAALVLIDRWCVYCRAPWEARRQRPRNLFRMDCLIIRITPGHRL